MTPPTLHDVKAAAKIVRKSPSWLYQKGAAGEIPRTKIGHHVGWTDEQLTQIIRDGAQPAKPCEARQREQKRQPQAAKPERRVKPKAGKPARVNAANIPVADFSVSRLYRQEGAA